jgi:hypothetical protein
MTAAKKTGLPARLATGAFPVLISALLLGASTRSAHAYLDAGTGSMILQVLLGGVAGMALVGKLYWHRLLVMLRIRQDVPAAPAGENEAGSPGR